MCWDILSNPGRAFVAAKKTKAAQKAWVTLVEASVLIGLTAIVVSFIAFGDALIAASAFVATLILSIVAGIILSWVMSITAVTLGGKGTFREGLFVASYSMLFFGTGLFIASLVSLIPVAGQAIAALVLLAAAATGMASLYRGIKEMFRTDMITSFVTVSIVLLAVIIAIWGTMGLSLAGNFSDVLSAVAVR